MSSRPAAGQSPSFLPSRELVLQGSTDPKKTRFCLFTDQWLDLQNHVQLTLELPITQGDFTEKYGEFPKDRQLLINSMLGAMRDVRTLSADFGNPSVLKPKVISMPGYFTGAQPPAEIYGHIIWTANQISNVSSTFAYMLERRNLDSLIGPGVPQNQRASNLRMLLVGQGGLASEAAAMRDKTQALINKLLGFDQKMTAANAQVVKFINSQDSLLALSSQLIGKIDDDIKKRLQPAADAALKAWRDFTIASVVTSVVLVVMSFGALLPLGAALGIGLGTAAGLYRAEYNRMVGEIQGQEKEKLKKTRLNLDLKGLVKQVGIAGSAMKGFLTTLGEIEGVFNTAAMDLNYIAANYTDSQLGDLNWLMQALKIGDAAAKWQAIAQSTNEYTSNSLVSYDCGSMKFGDLIAA